MEKPICNAMKILRIKWAYEIMDKLSTGTQRFRQLERNIVKTQSLINALRSLEEFGLIQRDVIPTVPITVEYSLTEEGRDF